MNLKMETSPVKRVKSRILDLIKMPEKINIGMLSWTGRGLYVHMNDIMRIYEKNNDEYISYYRRPRHPEQIVSTEEPTEALNSTAIVMQGPLIKDRDFTYETVRFYDKIFPGAIVIVSTWTDEDADLISRLRRLNNCEVVLNDYPEYCGVINVNYQAVSTLGGIKRAQELRREYVWKTRADYRFLRKGSIDYMVELMEIFPIASGISYQKKRIVGSASRMYRAWWVMDQYNFGLTEDMYRYWDHKLVKKNLTTPLVFAYLRKNHITWNDRVRKNLAAETSIVLDYFERMEGKRPEVSLKAYWEKLKGNYILLSHDELSPCFGKDSVDYQYDYGEWMHLYIKGDTADKLDSCMWDFQKWIALYRGKLNYQERYEKIGEKNTY